MPRVDDDVYGGGFLEGWTRLKAHEIAELDEALSRGFQADMDKVMEIKPPAWSWQCMNESEVILRIEESGDIYVHGRLAANDKEVVDGFREFVEKGYHTALKPIRITDQKLREFKAEWDAMPNKMIPALKAPEYSSWTDAADLEWANSTLEDSLATNKFAAEMIDGLNSMMFAQQDKLESFIERWNCKIEAIMAVNYGWLPYGWNQVRLAIDMLDDMIFGPED